MNRSEHVHFVGIGGYGMSAIARVMLDLGYEVSGSDVSSQELTQRLRDLGARIYRGHAANQVAGADLVVYSTALPQDNVELQEARRRNIPIVHRSEMLARLMEDRVGVAVTGAHGKTTTTSMIAYVMERCGLDPTFVIGGVVSNIGDNAKAGRGQYVVAEADESDGSFLHYRPNIAVVTNIEPDHLEHYGGKFENLKRAYAQFIGQIPESGLCVMSGQDEHLRELRAAARCRVMTYAVGEDADYTARDVALVDRGSHCTVWFRGERLGTLVLSLPGVHNVMNALAAIAVGREAGLAYPDIAQALHEFHGAKRRFQVIAEAGGVLVIDDYAHHPTEISATIAAAKTTGRRIVAVFQPQRYTRTFFLFDAFAKAFGGADEVVITDIYSPAGEQQIEGVSAEKLAERIRLDSNPNTRFLPTKDDVYEYLVHTVRPGDLVMTMGAGDIWRVAYRLGAALGGLQETAYA
ncbi:UDP-N-acetylmuramate--L-alanine ligase [Alicyclobacillus macrosporangiidus]|uniref:UDP-N-acetylmuramate--L-alanine ligase n=1 Tax=Alicyclobacillus macrosporangiidus TaxID=392015 RepID=A0A1I7JVR3_9BACL|nr:UDP-N-acetylmuramate--L-alanine ligase [Alicyclobacillus macrosporangiidus]SFU89253.1 UDP-N-acetylmuramate--alanine ligase [Alicyclobacillus macrosporangiidus]